MTYLLIFGLPELILILAILIIFYGTGPIGKSLQVLRSGASDKKEKKKVTKKPKD